MDLKSRKQSRAKAAESAEIGRYSTLHTAVGCLELGEIGCTGVSYHLDSYLLVAQLLL